MPLGSTEPNATAGLILLGGLLLVVSVLSSRAAGRTGVPVLLAFLVVGMLAGSEGLLGIAFEDYAFTYRLGTVALALILFDGGLHTSLASVRRALRPAGVLATVGVVGTALLTACGARLCGLDWSIALLLGAIVSSTDAAAVFAVLRSSGIHLRRRPGLTLELESGLNDPMAVILTVVLSTLLTTPATGGEWIAVAWSVAWQSAVQLSVGVALGLGLGWLGRWLLRHARLGSAGLYPVLSLGVACAAYGLPTLLWGSGFLAVFLAGMLIGNARIPHHAGLLRVHEAIAWFSQVAMFLLLGLLVFPSRLLTVAWQGLAIALVLTLIARPLMVAVCLAPFRFPGKEILFIGWTGLRGAVPIVLATLPVMQGLPGAERIFDLVFFLVVVGAMLPGATVPWAARRLGVQSAAPRPPQAVLEIDAAVPLRGTLVSYHVHELSPVAGSTLKELDLPQNAAVLLVVRGDDLIAPRGSTVIQPGDHVSLYCSPEDLPLFHLLFGHAEEE